MRAYPEQIRGYEEDRARDLDEFLALEDYELEREEAELELRLELDRLYREIWKGEL